MSHQAPSLDAHRDGIAGVLPEETEDSRPKTRVAAHGRGMLAGQESPAFSCCQAEATSQVSQWAASQDLRFTHCTSAAMSVQGPAFQSSAHRHSRQSAQPHEPSHRQGCHMTTVTTPPASGRQELGGVESSGRSTLPTPAYFRLPDVLRITSLSRPTLYRRIAARRFPAPIHLGGRACGWASASLQAWIDDPQGYGVPHVGDATAGRKPGRPRKYA
jgi:prophage regulatory protein